MRKILGILCIVAGLIALVVPFVPGIALIFVGLYFFGGVVSRDKRSRRS